MSTVQTDIDFPIPKFTGLDVAFGAPSKSYLTREQLGGEFYGMRHPMCRIAQKLFFEGGRLADHGIQFKPGIDRGAAMAAIQAWLSSFEPQHEIKIGHVGYALSKWCEPLAERLPDRPSETAPASDKQKWAPPKNKKRKNRR